MPFVAGRSPNPNYAQGIRGAKDQDAGIPSRAKGAAASAAAEPAESKGWGAGPSTAAPARTAPATKGWVAEKNTTPDLSQRGTLQKLSRADFSSLPLPKKDFEAANSLFVFAQRYQGSRGDAKLSGKEMELVKKSVSLIANAKPQNEQHVIDGRRAMDTLIIAGGNKGADVKELIKLARTLE